MKRVVFFSLRSLLLHLLRNGSCYGLHGCLDFSNLCHNNNINKYMPSANPRPSGQPPFLAGAAVGGRSSPVRCSVRQPARCWAGCGWPRPRPPVRRPLWQPCWTGLTLQPSAGCRCDSCLTRFTRSRATEPGWGIVAATDRDGWVGGKIYIYIYVYHVLRLEAQTPPEFDNARLRPSRVSHTDTRTVGSQHTGSMFGAWPRGLEESC